MVAIVWLGVYPQPLFDTAAGGLFNLQHADRSRGVLVELQR
jgi:hypothetical protein